MSDLQDNVNAAVLKVLRTQDTLNEAVTRALEAIALNAERYEAVFEGLRSEIGGVRHLLLQHVAETGERLHSVRVDE